MKVAVITCYKQPDYIRAVGLRRAVAAYPDAELLVVKNKRHRGVLRYFEVSVRLLWLRLRHRPDVYIQTFRGYETLPLVLLLAGRRPVIFDELINAVEWVTEEHRKFSPSGLPGRIFASYYNFLLRRCRFILADTPQHAEHSAALSGIKLDKYVVVPVAADEDLIKPKLAQKSTKDPFTVFYYGNVLPLHGLPTILQAAVKLKDQPINFVMYGMEAVAQDIKQAQDQGARIIESQPYFDFREIAEPIAQADLCLAGPFGDTVQSKLVITGKTFQYMASGKPAVVGRTPTTQAVFRDKQNCLMADEASPESLAEAIKWAAAHPKELQQIADNGHKLYQQKFSQKVVNRLVADLLKRLA